MSHSKSQSLPQSGKESSRKIKPSTSFPAEDNNKEKQKAERREVAGRHKNDARKDHKGAR